MVGDTILRIVVGANLFTTITSADLRATDFLCGCVGFVLFNLVKSGSEDGPSSVFVVELRFGICNGYNQTSRSMV